MRRALFLLSVLGLALAAVGCRSPYYADRGAAFGGLTGAGVGALVGEAVADNPLVGAVVGGTLGAATGAVVGDSIDADIARNNAIIQDRLGRRLAGAVTPQDIVMMTQAGLSDEVIVTHIRAYGVSQPPQVGDLIALKQQGVSDRVINALQQQPPLQTSVAAVPASAPVIVEEHYYTAPRAYYYDSHWGHHHHPHYYRRPPRPGWSLGVSVGN